MDLLRRTFTHAEIFPPEFGCAPSIDTQGTPLDGSTLLHMCADFDELEIARWLLERGMDPDATAAIDGDGFGGHTALFGGVVSYAHFGSTTNAMVRAGQTRLRSHGCWSTPERTRTPARRCAASFSTSTSTSCTSTAMPRR